MGSPEKPLSDLGLLTYRSYWRTAVLEHLRTRQAPVSIQELSDLTGMTIDDVVSTLQDVDLLFKNDRDEYAIELKAAVLDGHFDKVAKKNYPRVKEASLRWTPYALTRR